MSRERKTYWGKPKIDRTTPETHFKRLAKKRKPQEWIDLLHKVENIEVRVQCASVIWWNFVADRPDARDSAFREIVESWKYEDNAPDILVKEALMGMGYTEKLAIKHSRTEPNLTGAPKNRNPPDVMPRYLK